jgi:uncharacterized membrane protein
MSHASPATTCRTPESHQHSARHNSFECVAPAGPNVHDYERIASLAAGAALTAFGLFRAQHGRLPLAALGAAMVSRGLTGRCHVYKAIGIDTRALSNASRRESATVIPAQHGEKVEHAVTIARPAQELYAFWRDLKNLPTIMQHLKSVEVDSGGRSRWTAVGPLGRSVEWDAEIINEREPEVIAWQSLPGSTVDVAGSVHFAALAHKRGTRVTVSLKYSPPAGAVGAWLAWLLGADPAASIADDLRNFKRVMETGELPTTAGQPSGRESEGEPRRSADHPAAAHHIPQESTR